MQISSIDSLSSRLSIDVSSDTSTSLPLIGSVANIDAKPQTTISVQDTAIAGTSQNIILNQLKGSEQGSQFLLQESEEIQLTSVLRSLSKLDKLFYDENMTKFLIKYNDPRKYSYVELFTSALYTQAAWYRVKNRVLELMYFIPQKKKSNITQGKMGLAVAITNLITNKIKHQACLNKIQLKNFVDLSDCTNSESDDKTGKYSNYQITRARKILSEYRRYYDYSLAQRGIEESAILENFPQCLSDNYIIEAIKKIFVSLPKEKIKELIQYHVYSLFSSVEKMEAHAFNMKRTPVPESFWNSLGKCYIQDREAFHRHFFLFLLSNWLSEPEYLFWQKRELKEAITTNNAREECTILINKSLQLSLLVEAQKIFHQILVFVKEYDSLMLKGTDEVKLALALLNNAYTSAFTKVYQPYIERKKINWNLKTQEECQAQVNLLNVEISIAAMNKTQLFDEGSLDVTKLLGFIYAVLLHFRDNYAIDLTNLNDIATRTITELTDQQIQEQKYVSNEQAQTNSLVVVAQTLKRKRKEKHQQSQISTFEATAQIVSSIAERNLPESEEIQFSSVLRSLFKLDELYYNEKLMKFFIKNDDPRKYLYVELFTSALYVQAAWYRLKNRVLDLMYFVPLKRNKNITKGNMGLAVAIANLINNKIKHQTYLNKIQLDNFAELSSCAKKTEKELGCVIRRVKEFLGEYRRSYQYSLSLRGIDENAVIENLPQYFLNYYSLKAIKEIFVSLSDEKIKVLVNYHVTSLSSSSVDKMRKHAFEIQRKPVPESFWHSLRKCSEQDWKAFNKHFFLFLLSNWLSEPEHLLWQNRELEKATAANNTREELEILADKFLQLSFRITAHEVLHQILSFAKEHERLIFTSCDDIVGKESALAELNNAYCFVFKQIHLPYIAGKKTDWNLKTPEECQAQVNLLKAKIENAHAIEKRLPNEESLDVARYIDFIYIVLLHFRDNYAIQLIDLNYVAARTITKPTAQQIQEQKIGVLAASQSIKIKQEEEKQSEHLQTTKIKQEELQQDNKSQIDVNQLVEIKREDYSYS